MLDLFSARFIERQGRNEEKITSGVHIVHPRVLDFLQESLLARKYNFKVRHRHHKEEKPLARQYKKILKKEEACSIWLDSHIQDLAIL